MTPSETYRSRLQQHADVLQRMHSLEDDVLAVAERMVSCFRSGGKILLAGNGGSAADAQHWAAEWVIRLNPALERPGMPAIALTTDSSILTAGANDLGYDQVIARQVEALGRVGDVFLAISTSGNSPNLVNAVGVARDRAMTVIGVLGRDGGKLAPLCDASLIVPASDTQSIQEMHVILGHVLCELTENGVYGAPER